MIFQSLFVIEWEVQCKFFYLWMKGPSIYFDISYSLHTFHPFQLLLSSHNGTLNFLCMWYDILCLFNIEPAWFYIFLSPVKYLPVQIIFFKLVFRWDNWYFLSVYQRLLPRYPRNLQASLVSIDIMIHPWSTYLWWSLMICWSNIELWNKIHVFSNSIIFRESKTLCSY